MRTSVFAMATSLIAVSFSGEGGLEDGQTPFESEITGALSSNSLTPPSSTRFSVLTYNVAGLPDPISQATPSINHPKISGLLNGYEVVLVQEDFAYHQSLSAGARHPFQSTPMPPRFRFQSDGLNRYSVFPTSKVTRHRWQSCNGIVFGANDCLADKGFSVSRLELTEGITLDLYNLHADAGDDPLDAAARRSEFDQLAQVIETYSEGHAVIVAGDTNLKVELVQDRSIFHAFLEKTQLTDTCHAVACRLESIDRILYRSSANLHLEPSDWRVAEEFVDERGQNLSDHPAIAVDFTWTIAKAAAKQPH
ncbi:MAG: endonuclease [Myxococcota bacterium]|nr:endonuclease [Myxococcota bacterium]